jgi:beta-lactamase regulating signal transducer with metallopeptidase domain
MNTLLALGLSNAGLATLIAGMAFVVTRTFKNPPLAHALWLLVILKLLTPPLLEVRIPWSAPEIPTESTAMNIPENTAESSAQWLLPKEPPPAKSSREDVAPRAGSGPSTLPAAPASEAALVGPPPTEPSAIPFARDADLDAARAFPLDAPAQRPSEPVRGASVEAPPLSAVSPIATDATARPAEESAAHPAPSSHGAKVGSVIPGPGLAAILFAVWAMGACIWFALAFVRAARFHRLLRRARPAPAEVAAEAREAAQRVGLLRVPEVVVVSGRVSPLVWPVGRRARVVLPEELLPTLSREQRLTLIAHEFAHLRRHDHWLRWLEMAALGLYWWFPVVWWARRELRSVEEECCDAWVQWAFPGEAREYARTIFRTVDFLSQDPVALPQGASGMGSPHLLERRFRMILQRKLSRQLTGRSWVALATFAVLVLPVAGAFGSGDESGAAATSGGGSPVKARPASSAAAGTLPGDISSSSSSGPVARPGSDGAGGPGSDDIEKRIRDLQKEIDRLQATLNKTKPLDPDYGDPEDAGELIGTTDGKKPLRIPIEVDDEKRQLEVEGEVVSLKAADGNVFWRTVLDTKEAPTSVRKLDAKSFLLLSQHSKTVLDARTGKIQRKIIRKGIKSTVLAGPQAGAQGKGSAIIAGSPDTVRAVAPGGAVAVAGGGGVAVLDAPGATAAPGDSGDKPVLPGAQPPKPAPGGPGGLAPQAAQGSAPAPAPPQPAKALPPAQPKPAPQPSQRGGPPALPGLPGASGVGPGGLRDDSVPPARWEGGGESARSSALSPALDIVRLADAIVEAEGAVGLAQIDLNEATRGTKQGVLSQRELSVAEVRTKTAERKLDILLIVARSAIRDTQLDIERLSRMLEATRSRYKVGMATEEDVLQAESRQSRAQSLLDLLQSIAAR